MSDTAVPTGPEAYVTIVLKMTPELEEEGILENLACILDEDYDVDWDIEATEVKPIFLTRREKNLLRKVLSESLQLETTKLRLTHPSNPIWDSLSSSEAALRALLKRVRRGR